MFPECRQQHRKISPPLTLTLSFVCCTYVAGAQDKQGSFHSGEQVPSVFDKSSFNKVLVKFPIFVIQSITIKRELENDPKVDTTSWRCNQLLSNLHT